MTCTALILAAGESRRLGYPKQTVRLQGETLLDRAIRTARQADCSQIVVVLGAHEHEIRRECGLKETLIISHPNWEEGMGSSLARGISLLHDCTSGIVVMTCDMPAVTPDHLRTLMSSGVTTVSSYGQARGVPAYFPCTLFPELLKASGDAGAKNLLREACVVALPGGTWDIDTTEDLLAARNIFG